MGKYLPEYLPQMAIDKIVLSPNERYLAIYVSKLMDMGISSETSFLLLDTLSGDIYSTCLTPDFYSPAWSPNSQYIVLTTTSYANPATHVGEGLQLVIADAYNQQFYEIKRTGISLSDGWIGELCKIIHILLCTVTQ